MNMQPQDTTVHNLAGPRFRPFASPNHHVTKGRYITSNDPRGYIPVYEYPLNGQWIMMDIDDGYILWTGIWKALGNSKADIVKMIDSQPDLAHVIRRVRGGYLKIQGTWMPYEVALKLSRRVAWPIRDDLIPLFGPTFPSTCLTPDHPGYGQVVSSGNGRRRSRRNTQSQTGTPREGPVNWAVTSNTSHPQPSSPSSPYAHYPMAENPAQRTIPPISFDRYAHQQRGDSISSSRERHRYSPYQPSNNISPVVRKLRPSTGGALSLDIPSLSLEDQDHSQPRSPPLQIMLPPIQPPDNRAESQSPYVLPPISALEDLRGVPTHDSAAVLRRLREDDTSRLNQEIFFMRRWSLSAPTSRPIAGPSSRSEPSDTPKLMSREQVGYRSLNPSFEHIPMNTRLGVFDSPSNASHDGYSTCDPSPVSPATPWSAASPTQSHVGLVPLSILKQEGRISDSYYNSSSLPFNPDWVMSTDHEGSRSGVRIQGAVVSACRHSCESDSSDGASVPLRTW